MTPRQATQRSRNLNQRARTFMRKAAKLNARSRDALTQGRNYDAACYRIEALTAEAHADTCREQAAALLIDAEWEREAYRGRPPVQGAAGFADSDLDGVTMQTVSLSGGAR